MGVKYEVRVVANQMAAKFEDVETLVAEGWELIAAVQVEGWSEVQERVSQMAVFIFRRPARRTLVERLVSVFKQPSGRQGK